jgi:hypothetical protein
MLFPPQFLDELRARLPLSEVVGKRFRLKKVGREWKGLSPFNKEQTPSFFVNDQKGLYHDFSSGKHGDIFTFTMETEGVTFCGSGGTAGRARRPCAATMTGSFTPLHPNAPLLPAGPARAARLREALASLRPSGDRFCRQVSLWQGCTGPLRPEEDAGPV